VGPRWCGGALSCGASGGGGARVLGRDCEVWCRGGGVADAFKGGIRGSRGGATRESPARIAAVIAGRRCAEAGGAG